ncbi:MAG: hypothetical protein ACTSW1_07740 [Candidatus Hodarchaeales archaeon]
MKIPCRTCICKPICRHKGYGEMLRDCSIIDNYIGDLNKETLRRDFWGRVHLLVEELEPSKFEIIDTPTATYVESNDHDVRHLHNSRPGVSIVKRPRVVPKQH